MIKEKLQRKKQAKTDAHVRLSFDRKSLEMMAMPRMAYMTAAKKWQ